MQAREAAERSGNREAQGAALRGLAEAQQTTGAYRESLVPLLEAVAVARGANDPQGEASALGALGQAYGELGENAPAERYLREAVEVSKSIPLQARAGAGPSDTPSDVPTELTVSLLGELGNQHARAGNAAEALAAYQQSAGVARGNGAWLVTAQAQANAARAALALGDAATTRSALEEARESLVNAEPSPDEQTAFYLHLAYTEASFAQQDAAVRRPALRAAYGDLLAAHEAAERAGNARAASQALGQLGGLYAQEGGRDRESRHLTRRALQLAEQEQAAHLLARWYAQLGAIEWRSQRVDAALR
jgi:tetratricopeptide (TPR) repeat protein